MTDDVVRLEVVSVIARALLSFKSEDLARVEALADVTRAEVETATLHAAELRAAEWPVVEEQLAALVKQAQEEDS